ncbi:MAG: DUF460 domain-containing protein [Candidatus Methanospirareceae archaeon]
MTSRTGRRYIIVGIDPGTTTGIAVLTLDGKHVETFSAKNLSISEVIAWIASFGKPLIIGTDVAPAPAMVKKIRSAFSSILHNIDKSLTIEEKIMLTKGFEDKYRNVHERDALAACIEAFRHYKNKFLQAEKKTPEGIDVEEVKALVVRGVSISKAIDRLRGGDKEDKGKEEEMVVEEGRVEEGKVRELRRIIREKEEQIERLRDFLEDLKRELKEKERKIEDLERRIKLIQEERMKEVEKNEEIKRRDREIKRLKWVIIEKDKEIAELKEKVAEITGEGKEEKEGKRRIKVIKTFSKRSILDVERRYGLEEGDVVFLEDGSGGGAKTAELLAKKGVSAVIYGGKLSHFAYQRFYELSIPTFSIKEIPLEVKGGFAFVDERLLKEKIEGWRNKRGQEKGIVLFAE